jgi:hypothetical protein
MEAESAERRTVRGVRWVRFCTVREQGWASSPWQKSQDSGTTTGETACPTELHQQFASVVGQAFSDLRCSVKR